MRKENKVAKKVAVTTMSAAMMLSAAAPAFAGAGSPSDAAKAYTQLNKFRTERGVSYWNQGNKSKTKLNTNRDNKLKPLKRDARLEAVAKKRAKEIFKRFGHTRPNGSSWYTAYPNLPVRGENIAMGTSLTAAEATNLWKATDKKYRGQGHRRVMLSSSFNAVGIASYKLNGNTYWVQCFGKV